MNLSHTKKFLTFGIISVAAASVLMADINTTLETPPQPDYNLTQSDINITDLETPPGFDGMPDLNVTDPSDTVCEQNSYYNPAMNSCVAIKPPTLQEVTNGIWLDMIVDKENNTILDRIKGCQDITVLSDYNTYADINVTSYFKDESNTTKIESTQYASYDETTGMLTMEFPYDDEYMSGDTASGTMDNYEEFILSKETIGDQEVVFMIKEEWFDGQNNKFVVGVLSNDTTNSCSDVSSQIEFVNDFFNPNSDMPIQVSGRVILPDFIDPYSVNIEAIGMNWDYFSGSQIDTFNQNQYTLGFNEAKYAAIRVGINTDDQFYEFFKTPDGLVLNDYNTPVENYMFDITETIENMDINVSKFFADQLSVDGSISFDNINSEVVSLDIIDLSNGNDIGYKEFDSNSSFSMLVPNAQTGSKYIIKANRYSSDFMDHLGSYFISFDENNQTKIVSDKNINWITNETGAWIPDPDEAGYITIPDSNSLPDLNISLTKDALDANLYVIEGDLTLPSDKDVFVYFDVIDKNTGENIYWTEYDKATNSYRIELSNPSEVIVRVNYEEIINGAYNYSSYYLTQENNKSKLTSEKNIEYIPVLEGMVSNNKTEQECFDSGGFVYQPDETQPAVCYDNHPTNWIPDTNSTGFIVLSEDIRKQTLDIDFAAVENDIYRLEGTITLPEGFDPSYDWENRRAIMVEAIDANTGNYLGSTTVSDEPIDGQDNVYSYLLKLEEVDDSTDIVVKVIREENTNDEWLWESYYAVFNDQNLSDVTFVSEETIPWKESQSDDGNIYYVPDVSSLNIASSDNLDGTSDKSIVANIDYTSAIDSYIANKLSIKGEIKLSEPVNLGYDHYSNFNNNIRVEVIRVNDAEYVASDDARCVDSTNCNTLSYDLDLPKDGNYSVKIVKEIEGSWEEYYYNFGEDHDVNGTDADADKIVNAQNIPFVEAKDTPSWTNEYKNWLHDPEQTSFITMQSGQSGTKTVNIDFTQFESSRLKLAGTIKLPVDFVLGEYCTNGIDTTEEVKQCEWKNPSNVGFNNLAGAKYARVEVIDKNTGEFVSSADITKKIPNTNEYEFELDLGDNTDTSQEFIVKISKESNQDGQWTFDEVYYNFGENNTYDGIASTDGTEKLVNGKKVMWEEASQENSRGYENWMPDADQTGFVSMDESLNDFYVDISQIGANDKKISGKITFKDDFDLSSQNSFADVSAIDAATGMWVGNTPVNDDGTFELNLGEETGEYILQVNYSYNDYNNWQNSWWKSKYFDFGEDKAYGGNNDEIKNDMDVRWEPVLGEALTNITNENSCWQSGNYWDYENTKACYTQPEYSKPNVNGLQVDNSISDVNIDLSAAIGNNLNISIANLPSDAIDTYVYIVDPKTYGGVWQNLNDGNVSISELKDGNYTIEFGYGLENSDEYKHFFIKDDDNDLSNGVGAISGNEVNWKDIGDDIWGPNPSTTTYANISEDTNITITIPEITYNTVDISLGNLQQNSNVDVEFRSVDKPYSIWEQLNSNDSTNVATSFDDVKNGEYILSFNADGAYYTLSGEDNLVKDPEWVAKDSDGNIVCGGTAGWDNCDYSQEMFWMPDVTPLTFDNEDKNISVSLPTLPTVSAVLDLGVEMANKRVDFNIWQHNGNNWNWKQVDLNSTGGANVSMKVEQGSDYIIELWADGLGGYTYTTDKNLDDTADDTGWITSYNTWADDGYGMWAPRDAVLTYISESGLDLGTANIGSDYNKVTISVENLDTQDGQIVEDVWVSLEGVNNEGYYGEGNANWEAYPVTYDQNITLKVPAGDYRVMVFPMNHKGGYASDGDGTDDSAVDATSATLTKLGWNEQDQITVDGEETITVTLPQADTLGSISGIVQCGSDDCSGWVDAWNTQSAKGSVVESDGTFEIKGLEVGTYELTYWSYLENVILSDASVEVTANTNTEVNSLVKSETTTYGDINGTVTTSVNGVYVSLLETDGTNWEFVSSTDIKSDGSYSFGSMPKVSGKEYYVVGTTLTRGESSYEVKYAAPQSILDSSSISLPSLGDNAYSGDDITVTVEKQ